MTAIDESVVVHALESGADSETALRIEGIGFA
jgi:hypothetical protein